MNADRRSVRGLALVGALAAPCVVFFTFVRPWYRQWGASPEEQRMTLPGDAIIPNAAGQGTRAITIHAGVDRVWPWLAQLGQDRGGFYSFDLLENLVGCEMPTTDMPRPDKQSWRLGDKLWTYPQDKAGGVGFATLRAFVPGRALGFATRSTGTSLDEPEDGSWSMVLQPVTDSTARLLIRGRGAPGRSLLGAAFDRSIFEPAHFVMERRMMIGIKQLAEGSSRGRFWNHTHVVLWTIAFGLFITAAVMVLRAKNWRRPLAGFLGAGILFQVLTLVQPSPLLGALLLANLIALFWWPNPRDKEVVISGRIPLRAVGVMAD